MNNTGDHQPYPLSASCYCVSSCYACCRHSAAFGSPPVQLWVCGYVCVCVCSADASVCQNWHGRLADSGCHLPSVWVLPLILPRVLVYTSINTLCLTSVSYLEKCVEKVNRKKGKQDKCATFILFLICSIQYGEACILLWITVEK